MGITVLTEFPVSSQSPEIDILLLRNHRTHWADAQKARLPDGIRDCQASHILLEFKYTESINREAFLQTLSYDTMYQRSQRLRRGKLQSFLLSSKTPGPETIKALEFVPTETAGIYQGTSIYMSTVTLVLLNELSEASHNVPLKCFASRQREQKKAFAQIQKGAMPVVSKTLEWLIQGLQKLLILKGSDMSTVEEITPEYLIEVGKEWTQHLLSVLPPEERLVGLKPEEILANLSREDIENYLKALQEKSEADK